MDWGQLANLRVWADRWYDARITATIVNSSEIKSMQQRKTRNVNKLRIAELNHEGVLLLREHLSRAHDISRRAHDILIIGKTRQSIDEDELFGSLLTYVERVRAIKAEFLAYQKTREKASFLDTDMAGIAVCELTICRIINAYEEWGHISFLLARYRNPLFWAPRALIDDDYRVADLKDDPPPNNVHHLGETTVLNAVRGLDQRYLWMQVYNALSHAKMIRPDE